MSDFEREPEMTMTVTSSSLDAGKRVDAFIAEKTGLTRSAAVRLIEDGSVLLGEKHIAKNYKVKDGDVFDVEIPEPDVAEAIPQDIPIDVIYEDGDVIVVNKPKGMVVHPAPGNPDGTLVHLKHIHLKELINFERESISLC